ncbi:MAG: lipoprotein signal peptidase [Bacteroidales bacterium]
MKKSVKLSIIASSIVFIFIALDQLLKIWIKTNMFIGEDIPLIGNWFRLYFVENEGMAFGISLGANAGKLILSFIRIGVVGFLIYYLGKQIRKNKIDTMVVIIFSLIIAGALGNIIDCLFYGMIFSESTPWEVATAFPPEGGYAPFFYGKVVDMFYFPLFQLPEWFPLWGGSYFFPAIFNIADSCVTVGIVLLLIFNKRVFKEESKISPETVSPSDH